MNIELLLRQDVVIECWYDREDMMGERYIALVSRGKAPQTWRGYGPTLDKAIKRAMEWMALDEAECVNVTKADSPKSSVEVVPES